MKAPRNAVIAHKKPVSEMLKARKAANTKPAKEKASTKKKNSVAKDPDAPKRPPTAFFVFMEEFRKDFKEKFPDNKTISAVGKAGGEKWKSLSDSDRAPYTEKALKKKAEYEKALEVYKKQKINNNNNGGNEKSQEGSQNSTSEVNNDDEQEASS